MYPTYYNQNQQSQVGFMSIRGRDIAVNYPIAPGNTIFFKDELAPYVYVKTMGYSPLDRPTLETYRREDAVLPQEAPSDDKEDNSIVEQLNEEIKTLSEEIKGIKKTLNTRSRKKEIEDDEQ